MSNTSPASLLKDVLPGLLPGSRYQKQNYVRLAKHLNLFLRKRATVADLATVDRKAFAEFLGINWAGATVTSYMQAFDSVARKLGMMPRPKPNETLAILARMKEAGHAKIFPLRSMGTFYHDYTRLLELAGLPTDRKSKPHRMRKSVASHMEARGHDACAALASDVLPSLSESEVNHV